MTKKVRMFLWRRILRLFAQGAREEGCREGREEGRREAIEELYLGIVGREPGAEEIAAYVESAKGAGGAAGVVRDLLQSNEYRQRSVAAAAPELVKAGFRAVLGRELKGEHVKAWAASIRNEDDFTHYLERLISGEEFKLKTNAYLNRLDENVIRLGYRLLYGREAESDGIVKSHLRDGTILKFRTEMMKSNEFKVAMKEAFAEYVKIPPTPPSLGPAPARLKILALGTCQIGALLSVGGIGVEVKHMLMTSGSNFTVPEVDLTGMDAAVVGLTLRAHIHDTCMARMRNADEARAIIERCAETIRENVAALHPVLGSVPTFFISFYEPSFNYTGNLMNRYDLSSPRQFVQKLNEALSNILSDFPNFYFIDANEIMGAIGRAHLQDDMIGESGHASVMGDADYEMDKSSNRLVAPRSSLETYNIASYRTAYVRAFWNLVADNLKILRQSNPVKLIIVDLDHTLWRGVAAEDNLEAHVRIAGWPLAFVEALLFFKKRGGLLAICSKNDHEPTVERMKQIWGWRITLDDFVSVKINWKSKSSNIAEILSETNLLPNHVVFIDDNPREIDEVQAVYPMMRCLSEDHMDWRRIILRAPETQVAVITEESSRRSALVRARVEREAAGKTMPREEWLKSLSIEQRIFVIRDQGSKFFDRAFELINKTNQFNTTGRRWELAEMKEFLESGGVCVVTSLKDKTIDNGIIGAALVKGGEIVQAVLSCRVFGLGAELSMGRVATEIALSQAAQAGRAGKATGRIVDTGKNFTCHKYYANLGFQSCNGHFEATQASAAPDWIAVHVEPAA